jgi:CHAD domain-containing protein
VRDSGDLWQLRAQALERARKSARRGELEGLHDLRVALRRIAATAGALGPRSVSRDARALVRSLSEDRQIQVDRELLARIGKLGYLSPDATTALAARWEKLADRANRRILKTAQGAALRSLRKDLEKLSRRRRDDHVERLEKARRKAEETIARSLEGQDDDSLHRHRIAVKKARYLAEDLSLLGVRRFASRIEREKALQETLGRWNDLRLFARRLAGSRDEAEERGAVTLAAELDHLLESLASTVAAIRREAVEASRETATVVPLERRRSARR